VLISIKRISRRSGHVLAAAAMVCHPAWGAATLTVTGVNVPGLSFGTTVANGLASQTGTVPMCTVATVPRTRTVGPCTDTAFVVHGNQVATSASTFASPQTFNGRAPTNQTFMTAFNNAVTRRSPFFQPNLAGWTIMNGGTLDVSILAQFTVVPGVNNTAQGGMFLSLSVDRYTRAANQPTAAQLVWTQAIYINYGPGTTNMPATTLDDYTVNSSFGANTRPEYMLPAMPLPVTNPATPAGQYTTIPRNAPRSPQMAYADPIYGGQLDPTRQMLSGIFFQSAAGVSQLVDVPAFLYSVPASFRAISLLTAVNTSTHVITVFDDGVSWGFDLTTPQTPEPSLRIFSLALLTLLFVAHRRRSKGKHAS